MGIFRNLEKQKFGRWTVLKRMPPKPGRGNVQWRVHCDCGTIRILSGDTLISGSSKSCGCLKIEQSRARLTTHGMRKTPLYNVWSNMRRRCNNSTYHEFYLYGGRGISVCDTWNTSFAEFAK